MKRLAHILVILLLLLSAGQAWAITINGVQYENRIEALNNPVGSGWSISTEDLQSAVRQLQAYRDSGNYSGGDTQNSIQADINLINRALAARPGGTPVQDTGNQTLNHGDQGVLSDNEYRQILENQKGPVSCGYLDIECYGWKFAVGVLTAFHWVVKWLLEAANYLLDLSIDFSVRNFRDKVGVGLREAWRVFRDLVNLTFIFTLLYIAIGTILQLNGVKGKNLLKNVIIAALLVNFSFFFTSIMIDASNVVANGLYIKAGQTQSGQAAGEGGRPDIVKALMSGPIDPTNSDSAVNKGIAAQLRDRMPLTSADANINRLKSQAASLVGQIILIIIATTVFMAGAILFLIRALILVFVLAASPVAFLAFAVGAKALDKISNKWKDALSNQLIFAPAFMLFIFMSIKVTQVVNSNINTGNDKFFNLLLAYLIANGLMLGSLMVAKELGVAGAAMATKAAGGINRFALKTIGGATGGLVGGTAKSAYGGFKEVYKGVQSGGWRGVRDVGVGLRKVATSPFVGAAAGATKAASVITSSGGNIKGKIADTFKKPDEAFNKAVSSITGVEILGEVKDKKKTQEEKEDNEKQKTKATAQKIANQINGNKLTPGSQEETEAEKAIKKMKDKNVVKLDATTLKTLAHLFSENQVKAIEKDNDIDDATKEAIRAQREQKMSQLEDTLRSNLGGESAAVGTTLAQTPTALIAKLVNDLDDKDADYKNILQTIASNLGTGRLEQLRNSGEINKRNRLQEIRRRAAGAATASPVGATTTQTTTVASVTPSGTGSNRSYEWPSPRSNNTNPQNINANINYHEGRN